MFGVILLFVEIEVAEIINYTMEEILINLIASWLQLLMHFSSNYLSMQGFISIHPFSHTQGLPIQMRGQLRDIDGRRVRPASHRLPAARRHRSRRRHRRPEHRRAEAAAVSREQGGAANAEAAAVRAQGGVFGVDGTDAEGGAR